MVRNSKYCDIIENLCEKNPLNKEVSDQTRYLLPASAESIYLLSQTGKLLTGYLFDREMCGDSEENRNRFYEKIHVEVKAYQKRAAHNRTYPTACINEIFINESARPYKPLPPLKESAKLAAAHELLAAKLHIHPHLVLISRPNPDVYIDTRQLMPKNPKNKMNICLKMAAMGKGCTEEYVEDYLQEFPKRKGVIVGIKLPEKSQRKLLKGGIKVEPKELNRLTFIRFLSDGDSEAYEGYLKT
jgi:hypothetical protein